MFFHSVSNRGIASYTVTIAKPTVITFQLQSLQPEDINSRYYAGLLMRRACDSTICPTADGEEQVYIGDNNKVYPTNRSVVYKLDKGIYRLSFSSYGLGRSATITAVSKKPAVTDTFGNDNDTEKKVKSFSLGKQEGRHSVARRPRDGEEKGQDRHHRHHPLGQKNSNLPHHG